MGHPECAVATGIAIQNHRLAIGRRNPFAGRRLDDSSPKLRTTFVTVSSRISCPIVISDPGAAA
jgi:hypothetical protein